MRISVGLLIFCGKSPIQISFSRLLLVSLLLLKIFRGASDLPWGRVCVQETSLYEGLSARNMEQCQWGSLHVG